MTASLDIEVDRPYMPIGDSGLLHTSITIDPGVKQGAAERQVIICIDASGSMSNSVQDGSTERIEAAKDGAGMVLGVLNDQDHFGLMTFSTGVDVHISPEKWGSLDADSVRSTIDGISARGGTDIYSALEKAGEMLGNLPNGDDVVREILLITDGQDNNRDAPAFESLATDLRQTYDTAVVSAGVGEYDRPTIKTIGTNSGGRYDHVSSASDFMQFFGDEVEIIEGTLATNPRLVFDAASGLEVIKAYRRKPQVQEADIEYENDTPYIELPKLLDRQEQKVAFKLEAPSNTAGEHTIAEIKLEAGSITAQDDLLLTYTDDESKLSQRNQAAFLEFLDTEGRIELEEGNLDKATDIQDTMEGLAGETEISRDLDKATEAVAESDDEEDYKEALDNATKVD
jgi:Ca-activated chloride channel family protein